MSGANTSSRVVTLSNTPVEYTDIKTTLRELLAKIESGEIECGSWLLLFERPSTGARDYVTTESSDSGMTIARVIHMIEAFKYQLFLQSHRTK